MDQVGVANVYSLFPGRETDSIRSSESICHNANVARGRIKAVYMLGKLGFGPEPLFVAVYRVCEPDRSVRVNDNVIGRIEGAGVVLV